MFSFCEQDVKRDELILAIAVLSACKLDIHAFGWTSISDARRDRRERGARVGDSRKTASLASGGGSQRVRGYAIDWELEPTFPRLTLDERYRSQF
ncbi:MAG: hypothetical protein CLLPBCKN_006466 [Chroococcidiopsis cubana SAG 39.79]|uniref:hypothetical protein n=1 Tax=Chroococcidiopsis cubana TaxID=171392 RepID=UPI000D073B1F|nr:hypothetical protein [Chroococcidiopsis cubana]MDZ4877031.1 hypothetical protein [Chroococcidiopsis cubana SAG 39.79]PSB62568.1 hypothetical protein C7B79_17475 [Chroococcidiopsis cubana CCALA 043]